METRNFSKGDIAHRPFQNRTQYARVLGPVESDGTFPAYFEGRHTRLIASQWLLLESASKYRPSGEKGHNGVMVVKPYLVETREGTYYILGIRTDVTHCAVVWQTNGGAVHWLCFEAYGLLPGRDCVRRGTRVPQDVAQALFPGIRALYTLVERIALPDDGDQQP